MYSKGLHRFAVLTAAFIVFLIGVGASVTSTGSGDAVPDWPLSYGTLFPRMVGGVFYEHGHRLVAGTAAILITILMIWLLRSNQPKYVKTFGVIAFVAVLLQAILGGLRVLVISDPEVQNTATEIFSVGHVEPIRMAIAITHATLAEIVLCMTFLISLFTSKAWVKFEADRIDTGVRIAKLYTLTFAFAFIQILLGALVRHTQSGMAIPDFPLSFGKIIPPFGNLPYDPNAPFQISYAELQFKVAIHFAHRVWAFVVAGVGIYASILAIRTSVKLFRNLAKMWISLIVLQILLGAFVVWTKLAVLVTVLHVAVGATILGMTLILSVLGWKSIKLAVEQKELILSNS
ncbi:cytochrome c oxidase assembly protein subunit 15 [Candidatus Kryptonium thompsonii]|jgi:cytochrome c oxidase assembly protein subunit 15|uniref:Cytochrome c oxidase assembly protein subunit 15 n=1 Tax=Candidatus Kryptonium thompsonii TaxID=1633631 RepID=A0A0P1LB15_9BACT|nr:COX15/CtaA family protein [Candidatus Kryptonium thompsoni]CUS78350.1 cytochrome c oxidase assembly protein subunit 15 [Candidatus Kryptonium thompsoni]CUS81866.1 cytochrome c oxidase assembly protein subunit 15 [Candidatus Kryptonium thompsoni]CUS82253.1 cytochrome c oxidase assembly protein subunit 15 [Candidatus Kryptonium thompsoni]CUS88521.1 cytochrome c oxidase assembly protein subunit 15 [Candidatus Kryptonium thompsoni]CUS94356.1 cytochrome c oxidase assembly protein subunit 15 [Can